jgi:hypothetical protein
LVKVTWQVTVVPTTTTAGEQFFDDPAPVAACASGTFNRVEPGVRLSWASAAMTIALATIVGNALRSRRNR